MTEAEWWTSDDPGLMLAYLWHRAATERKLRLFAIACCRRLGSRIVQEDCWAALEVAEAYADGLVAWGSLDEAWIAVDGWLSTMIGSPVEDVWTAVSYAVNYHPDADRRDPDENWAASASHWAYSALGSPKGECEAHCALVRDIFGNPFRPTTIDPTWPRWNDGTVPKIAQGIYEERTFDRLPILADALLDAGCDDEAILSHCRSTGLHVRGCWVIDLILGKS